MTRNADVPAALYDELDAASAALAELHDRTLEDGTAGPSKQERAAAKARYQMAERAVEDAKPKADPALAQTIGT